MKLIEIFEKVVQENGTQTLIAECNVYDENNVRIAQLSRSPFTFDASLTEQEIIASIQQNEYSIYF